jgi:hypothetical protein
MMQGMLVLLCLLLVVLARAGLCKGTEERHMARRGCISKIVNKIKDANACTQTCCSDPSCKAWFLNDYEQCFMCYRAVVNATPAAPESGCKLPIDTSNCTTGVIAPPAPPAVDWDAAAEFKITNTVAFPDPGAWTATMADQPQNMLSAASYEPMIIKKHFYPTKNLTNVVETDNGEADFGGYDSFSDGLLDGGSVRVYRLYDGHPLLVRTDTVKKYRASGWTDAASSHGMLVSPSKLSFVEALPSWFKPNTSVWYAVSAVAKDGSISLTSSAAVVTFKVPPSNSTLANNSLVPKPSSRTPGNSTVPSPAHFTAEVDVAAGVIRLAWSAVAGVDTDQLAGYLIRRADKDPKDFLGFGIDLLHDAGSDEAQAIQYGDLVFVEAKRYTWSRSEETKRVWGTNQQGENPQLLAFSTCENTEGKHYCPDKNDVVYNNEGLSSWELVAHPSPVPPQLAAVGGATCAKFNLGTSELAGGSTVSFSSGGVFASMAQAYYPVLQPTRTYAVEIWMRLGSNSSENESGGYGSGATVNVTLTLAGGPKYLVPDHSFIVNDQWQKFEYRFSPKYLANATSSVGSIAFSWLVTSEASSTMFIDNFRCYDATNHSVPFGLIGEDLAALQQANMSYVRTHSFIKSSLGYTMQSLLNPPGVTEFEGHGRPHTHHTLSSYFAILKNVGTKPWLQLEMFFSEAELLQLVEYLAAPYDASKGDTPASKPAAYLRVQAGQHEPWLDVFDSVILELGNELWNGMFTWGFAGRSMVDHSTTKPTVRSGGELEAIWLRYMLKVMRSSRYWTKDVASKVRPIVGGWALNDADAATEIKNQTAAVDAVLKHGWGTQGVKLDPGLPQHFVVAGYLGGWDEGEPPAAADDPTFFETLSFTEQNAKPNAMSMWAARQALAGAIGSSIDYAPGTYEAGPGRYTTACTS